MASLTRWMCPNLLCIGPDSCLRSQTTAIMPHGQKSKHRACEKRCQAQTETQGLHDQATTSGGEETTSSSPPDSESAPSSSSAAGTSKGSQGAQGSTSAVAGAIRKRSGGGGAARSRSGVGGAARSRSGVGGAARSRSGVGGAARSRYGVGSAARSRSGVGAEGQVQEGENSSQASAAAASSHTDLLTWKAELLVQYMLYKYKMRELIKRSEMLQKINRRYKEQFPEILSRASECIEMLFGLVLKEVRPNSHCYILVSNLDLSDSESMRGDGGLPKNGLLMPLLGVIYLNGNHAPEEKIWKFLNMLGIYDGRSHFIFGEPRKLITEDLVREGYLEYQQVPGSDPPRYEFLCGPKALTETSKTKVLQFLAKVKDLVHPALQPQYEEAWREEVESTGARGAARAGTSASTRPGTAASAAAGSSASTRPGTAASAAAGTSASTRPGTAASASPGPSASARPGTTASASAGTSASTRPGTAASASAGPSASATAHPRAESSRSSRP
ncbi:melanoma-associated antigen B4-like [Bubalus kerabau]|uniref:melanoma-associated antigen B4-like n=1 Tax=Bubalus carabanensis TaxID=3119969 RepID=UPI00244EDC4A|nr:melanoma-associated antigen B4-like [Bubalus carabanensis]XP_055419283.1 melanoma-associated antigen B4-like [Bubalus carabanensis]XP_055419284.1 melanoma-associated antigen B4-like [Bubalus carabanensis]XP_055419285.1 melanoma-associated antigen B4-like [Bubalus carabanensis]XP_055419286.1 melanoma-associated antigen B4-like [Bubalus carabanensis]